MATIMIEDKLVHIRLIDPIHFEAFIEQGFDTVVTAKGVLTPKEVIVDQIETHPDHREKGFAKAVLLGLFTAFRKEVVPFAVKHTAYAFWKKWTATQEQLLAKQTANVKPSSRKGSAAPKTPKRLSA
jgi:hypothetical protein